MMPEALASSAAGQYNMCRWAQIDINTTGHKIETANSMTCVDDENSTLCEVAAYKPGHTIMGIKYTAFIMLKLSTKVLCLTLRALVLSLITSG
jgi:hypothetical protein